MPTNAEIKSLAMEFQEAANNPAPTTSPELIGEFNELVDDARGTLSDKLARAKIQYLTEDYARTTDLIPTAITERLRAEARSLVDSNTRRIDIEVAATGNTPRKMGSLPYTHFAEQSQEFLALYSSQSFRDLLAEVVGTPVLDATYDDEKITGTHQTKPGDTHGWHWGDHELAWIFIAEAPPAEVGGVLQTVPNTIWNKEDPKVTEHLLTNPVRSYHHNAGESYIFKTDSTLHRTVPMEEQSERIIVNFTYASFRDWLDEKTYETTNAVYQEDGE